MDILLKHGAKPNVIDGVSLNNQCVHYTHYIVYVYFKRLLYIFEVEPKVSLPNRYQSFGFNVSKIEKDILLKCRAV